MKRLAVLPLLLGSSAFLLLGGCASYSGSGLVPGQSTEADVRAAMGDPALVRPAPGGGEVLWYPRLPYGRESFAATLAPDGTLASIEQRLQPQYIARLQPGKSTADDVLDTLGPPNRVTQYPLKHREAWEYQLRTPPEEKNLYVEISPDRVVRSIYQLNERDLEWFPGFRFP